MNMDPPPYWRKKAVEVIQASIRPNRFTDGFYSAKTKEALNLAADVIPNMTDDQLLEMIATLKEEPPCD